VTPYFYKIPVNRAKGEDVSALEAELKEKLSQLNEVGWNISNIIEWGNDFLCSADVLGYFSVELSLTV